MAQKINPNVFRLSVTKTWLNISHSFNQNRGNGDILYMDNIIRKLIMGTFNSFQIFTSNILIKHKPAQNKILISFLYFPISSARTHTNNKANLTHPLEQKIHNQNISFIKAQQQNILSWKSNISYVGFWGLFSDLQSKNKFIPPYKYSYLVSYLESFLEKRFNKSFEILIVEAPTYTSDSQILAQYIAYHVNKEPLKFKTIIKRAFWDFDKLLSYNTKDSQNNHISTESFLLKTIQHLKKGT